jgi:hypothetical protein
MEKAKEPRKSWRHVPVWGTLTDHDGSTWQIQKNLDTGIVFPAMVREAPSPVKPDIYHRGLRLERS